MGVTFTDVDDDEDFGDRMRLGTKAAQQSFQQLAAVPHGHHDRDRQAVHDALRLPRKRFLTRNQRFWNPSRQGFSFFSPSRDEY